MRFTILLTLCVLGVASASSLNKRGVSEDLQSQGQNALKAIQDFTEQAKHNAEDALKKLMDFFNQFNKKPEAESTEEKTVEKRDLAENLKKLTGQAKENFEKNLKSLQDFFAQFNKQPVQAEAPVEAPVEAEAEVVVAKRDLAENLKKLTGQAKENFEKNLKALQDFFAQFNKQPVQAEAEVEAPVEAPVEAEAEVVVAKREAEADNGLSKLGNVTAGSLLGSIFDPKKLQEQLITVLINAMAGRNKREVQSEFSKLTGQAKEAFEKNLKALQDFFAQFTKKPEAESTEEKTVEKRENNPMEMIEKFLKDAQTKAMNAGSDLQKAFEQFLAQFQKKADAPAEEVAAPAA